MIKIDTFRAGESNYNFLIYDESTREAIAVDPLEAKLMLQRAQALDLKIKALLNTHGHPDHVAGNAEVLAAAQVPLAAGAHENIPGTTQFLQDGATWSVGNMHLNVLRTPGHTPGHVCLIVNDQHLLVGDTLFYGGCGNCKFGGNPDDLYDSLQRLKTLPDHLIVYCGHEYTLKNFEFGCVHEPGLTSIIEKRRQVVTAAVAEQRPPLFTLGQEKEHNIFLRAASRERFKELRELRNHF